MRRSPRSSRLRRRALLGLAGSLAVVASLVDIEPGRVVRTARSGSPLAPIAELVPPANQSGVPASWAEQAQTSIARQEYAASRNDLGLQAPNRAHNIRTYFEPWGVRVEDRTALGDSELFRMKTVSIGRVAHPDALASGEIRMDGARVENRRRGGIVEWYENGEDGLEHGYVLDQRPAGDGALRIDVAFDGARVSMQGGRAVIDASTGRRLEYGKLAVEDAIGREVSARMELAGSDTVRLVVDDTVAVYPIVIDPLLTSMADATLQSDQASAFLGISVAGAGDVNGDGFADVIAGAYAYDSGEVDEGAAFVFHGGPSGVSSGNPSSANATLQSNQASAQLGWNVAGAGDVNGDGYADVIVGAHFYNAGQTFEGAAFVFHGGASGITSGNPSTANATLQGDLLGAFLGYSVAGAGDVNGDGYADVITGAYRYAAGQDEEGAAFVFHGSPSGIASGNPSTANTTLQSNQAFAELGVSVAGAGDVNGDGYSDVIVGSDIYADGQANEGAAFVFHGSSTGIASGDPSSANSTLQSNQDGAQMGVSVAGAGDVNGDGYADVIVGATLYDSGETNEGAAFVFHGGMAGISNGNPSTANATFESNQGSAFAGASVAGAGDVNGDGYADVIVGSWAYTSGQSQEGAAFLMHGGPSGISNGNPSNANATLQSDQAMAFMGQSAAGAGDVNGDGYADVIVGAYGYDSGQADEGAAFVYVGGAEGMRSGNPATAHSTLQSDQASALLGFSVAGAGDVNGDGYSDVIVGALFYDSGEPGEGAAFVFHGGPSGITSGNPGTANAVLRSNQMNAHMGSAVAGAGDVNGDGYADVIVGAQDYDAGVFDEGAAFIFHGGPSGITSGNPGTANAVLRSQQAASNMGFSVAGAGDVNGDGFADVIVGAGSYDAGQGDEGGAFVFHGGTSGVPNGNPGTASAMLQSDQEFAGMGSVAGAGDVNGDGYADVIVGAGGFDAGQQDEGAAMVFHGGPSGVANGNPSTANALLQSDQADAVFGRSVAGAGDVNGDGYADVIIGAQMYDSGQTDEGAAFVFHGGSSGVASGNPGTANAELQSDQATSQMGISVAGAGDVNGDGYADVIVGVIGFEIDQPDEGAAMVFHGGASGVGNGNPDTANALLQSDQPNADSSRSVAGAGDVNGDGYADVIIGAEFYDSGQMNEGAAFVFQGNGGGLGRTVRTQQLRGGDATNVEPWGSSIDPSGFRVRMTATHPEGRGRVKLQIEASPAGENWGGANSVTVTSSTWTDVTATTAGVTLTQTVSGLDAFTLYRWRARVLFAPFTFVSTGTIPAHGPWRRLRGQALEADIRTGVTSSLFGTDTAGIYVPSTGAWFLRNDNSPGAADIVFGYGPAGIGWLPLEGDWDGNGTDTAGLYDPVNGNFFLKNTNSPGGADLVYGFGPAGLGWKPLVGDWNGDGVDTVGLYDPVNGNFFLRNAHAPGPADLVYGFGPAGLGWIPLVGDWDGNASDTVGLYDPVNGNFFLRNAHAAGGADLVYGFGPAGLGWNPLSGDWNGDGSDTIGLYDPANGNFFLRNAHSPGAADIVFGYGPAGSTPIMGDWNGL